MSTRTILLLPDKNGYPEGFWTESSRYTVVTTGTFIERLARAYPGTWRRVNEDPLAILRVPHVTRILRASFKGAALLFEDMADDDERKLLTVLQGVLYE